MTTALIAKTASITVNTAKGPVAGWYERHRCVPEFNNREYEIAVGTSPFGPWRAQLRAIVASHLYTYPPGSTAANNAAIRRLVGKLLDGWDPSNFVPVPPCE